MQFFLVKTSFMNYFKNVVGMIVFLFSYILNIEMMRRNTKIVLVFGARRI